MNLVPRSSKNNFIQPLIQTLFVSSALIMCGGLWLSEVHGQQGGGQQILSGGFSFVQIPANTSFSSVASTETAQTQTWSYLDSLSAQANDADNLLIVEDLRDDGGFRIDMSLQSFETAGGQVFDQQTGTNGGSVLYAATLEPGDYGTIFSQNGVGYDIANTGPTDAVAPLDLGVSSPDVFGNFSENLTTDLTLINAPITAGQGRTGQFVVSVALGLEVPKFTPPGTYVATIIYTAYDATIPVSGLGPDPFDSIDDDGSGATWILPPTASSQEWGMQTLSSSDTEDWFKIALLGGQTLNLTTDAISGSVAAELCEDQLCNNPVAANTPASDGIYYIRATENSGGDANYKLVYSYASQFADASDPGDDLCANAISLTPTATEQQTDLRTLSASDAEDWFTFSASGGGDYNFNSIISSGDISFELYDSCGGASVSSDISSGGSSSYGSYAYLNLSGALAQNYYLKISQVTPGTDASYILNYSTNLNAGGEHSDDLFDHTPNGDDRGLSTPTALTPTGVTQTSASHTLTPSDSRDVYEFTATLGTTYNFTAVNIYGDLSLQILDSGFSAIEGSTNNSGAFNHNFTAPANETYYLSVKAHDLGSGDISYYDLEYTEL